MALGLVWGLAFASPQNAPKTPDQIIAEEQAAMGFIQPRPVGTVGILKPRAVLAKKEIAGCGMTAVVGSDGRVGRVRITQVSANVDLMLKDFVTWVCDTRYHPATLHGVPVPAGIQKTLIINASDGTHPNPSLQPPATNLLYDCRKRSWLEDAAVSAQMAGTIDVRRGGTEPAFLNQTVTIKEIEARFPDATFGPSQGVDPKVSRIGSVNTYPRGFLGSVEVLLGNEGVRLRRLHYFMDASVLRTVEGIGGKSTCEEVRAAYGTPARDIQGRPNPGSVNLAYQFGGTTVYFQCEEGHLSHLIFETDRLKQPGSEP